jgi:hypothetical protein
MAVAISAERAVRRRGRGIAVIRRVQAISKPIDGKYQTSALKGMVGTGNPLLFVQEISNNREH